MRLPDIDDPDVWHPSRWRATLMHLWPASARWSEVADPDADQAHVLWSAPTRPDGLIDTWTMTIDGRYEVSTVVSINGPRSSVYGQRTELDNATIVRTLRALGALAIPGRDHMAARIAAYFRNAALGNHARPPDISPGACSWAALIADQIGTGQL